MSKGSKSLNMFFTENEFIGSYLEFNKIPISNKTEVCFFGRSNVGKSSLINKITRNKNLAKTSMTPGRTRSINLFSINNKILFVDLPGYGFAKFSKTLKKSLDDLILNYLYKRNNLKRIFLLIDSKIGLKENDIQTISFIGRLGISFAIILTKIDKCTENLMNRNRKEILDFINNYPTGYSIVFSTSSIKNDGIINVQKNIYDLYKE